MPERFQTIRDQSLDDWELLVYDSYSEDGAWEHIREQGTRDARIRACLEKLVAALDANPECEIAHCRLRVIDQNGDDGSSWWSHGSVFARSSGPLLACPHVRKAPYDGLLHLLGETVYISITQLLIRRSLFDRIGMFDSAWGSVSDFNWHMRAGLVANTVHVPDTWGAGAFILIRPPQRPPSDLSSMFGRWTT